MKQIILDYDSFEVYLEDGDYWFKDKDEEEQPIKVKPIAILEYDINHEPECDGKDLSCLFTDYMCCGEYVYDDGISYIWFDIVEEGE